MELTETLSKNIFKYFNLYLFFSILLTLSPLGNLSGNEEMYYGFGKKFLYSDWNGEYSAFINSGNYRFLSDSIIGLMTQLFGFHNTQIIGSLFASLIFTYGLANVFDTLKLQNTYGLLAVITFILLGQSFIGREWLFEDFEAKIFSYFFVFLAIDQYLKKHLVSLSLLLSAATYFHFLVGASWFGLLILATLIDDKDFKKLFKIVGLYILVSLPIMFLTIYGFVGSGYVQDPDLPSPSYIYSYIRQYKMVVPFYSMPSFIVSWLPGVSVYFGLFIAVLLFKQDEDNLSKSIRILIQSSTVILFLLLFGSVFDTDGIIAKLYPYRFASLLLLIFLIYFALKLKLIDTKSDRNLGLAILVTVIPVFVINSMINNAYDFKNIYHKNENKIALYDYVLDNTTYDEVILIDPELEEEFYDLEREINRPSLVTFKYIPSSKEGLIEWYKRREFKSTLFSNGVQGNEQYPFHYLVTSDQEKIEMLQATHKVIFKKGSYVLMTNLLYNEK